MCFQFRSEILQRGVERLINQTIDQKAKSFQTRIEGVVQNYLYESNREKRERYRRPNRVSESKCETKTSGSEALSSSSKSDNIISQLLPSIPVTVASASTTAKSEDCEVLSSVKTPASRLQSHGSAFSTQPSTVSTATTTVLHQSTPNTKQEGHPAVTAVQTPVDSSSMSTSQHCGVAAPKSEVKVDDNVKCLPPESQKVNSVQRRPSPVLGKKAQQVKTKHRSSSPSETFLPSSKRPQSPSELTREHSSPKIKEEKVKKSSSVAMSGEAPQVKPCHDRGYQIVDQTTERAKARSSHSGNDKEDTTGNSGIKETGPVPSEEVEIPKTVDTSKHEKASNETPQQTSVDVAQDLDSSEKLGTEAHAKPAADTEAAAKLNLESLPSDSESHTDSKQNSVCGEDSLAESDISEISSVHTSDLSSFDEDVSSVSSLESENEGEEEGETVQGKREGDGNEGRGGDKEPDKTDTPSASQECRSTAEDEPMSSLRRSRRISSRRSTKEDTDDQAEQERKELDSQTKARKKALRQKYASTLSRRRQNRESGSTSCEQTRDPNLPPKRRRGRPRKEDREHRVKSAAHRESRRSVYESSEDAIRSEEASGELHVRHRSKRTVKRTRCYSPSSEGTREISLPSKRTRLSRD